MKIDYTYITFNMHNILIQKSLCAFSSVGRAGEIYNSW